MKASFHHFFLFVSGVFVWLWGLYLQIWLAPNSQSVAELWLEFFAYYAWKFDYVNEVVQIRHPKVLVKKRKGWDSSPFAVEDPFVLNHNLAATVDSDGNLSVPLFKFFSFLLPGFYKVC